jgi:hypothetical protein
MQLPIASIQHNDASVGTQEHCYAMQPPDPKHAGEIIHETTDFIEKSVTTLEASRSGWWKLIVLGIAGGAIAIAFTLAQKIDPHRPLESVRKPSPSPTSVPCQIIEQTVICDRSLANRPFSTPQTGN